MARGNTQREGRSARSELPSGVEATRADIAKLEFAGKVEKQLQAYANNWDKMAGADPAKLERMKSLVGDGKVGHGTLKDGRLYFSKEDVDAISAAQRNNYFNFDDEILNGSNKQIFRLISDDADFEVANKDYFAGMPESGAITIDGIRDYDLKREDGYIYSEEEPGYSVNPSKLIQDYKMGLGVDLDADSAKRLANRLEISLNAQVASGWRDAMANNQDELYERWREARR